MNGSHTRGLQASGLACVRGRRRLFSALTFGVSPGQALQVAGDNGAGKTSLLRQLAGLGRPSEGQVLWQGQPIERQRQAYAQQLLYQGHHGGLKAALTPLENLRAELALAGTAADGGALLAALQHWGLAAQARLPLGVLSAGQQRRVALARLLLTRAALWILDEPFNALDMQATAQLGTLVEQHLRRGGMAVLTSHQPLPLAPGQLQTLRLQA